MKKVFIVHGFGGIPNGGWISWLMAKLAKNKIYACSLPMPEAKTPVVSKWIEEIAHTVNNSPNDEIFLVGHSLGATAVIKYLESKNENNKIAGAIFVSGFSTPLDLENINSKYRTFDSFFIPEINFENVKNKAGKFVVIHSTNDPAVPFINAEKISSALNCELVKLNKGGHFFILSEPVCYELPELLNIILKETK